MKEEQKRIYHTIICEAWELMKDHLDKVRYEELAESVHKLSLKYEHTPEFDFAKTIVLGVIDELDRLHKVY